MHTIKSRVFSVAAALATAAVLAFHVLSPASAAKPRIIRDDCNQVSGEGMGHQCATEDHLLIRPKYLDGTCGDWMCCPPNPDGKTYNCAAAENPTRTTPVRDRIKELLGPKAEVYEPGPTTRPPKVFEKPKTKEMEKKSGA